MCSATDYCRGGYSGFQLALRTAERNGWNSSGVITPRGTDPTDQNDATWRSGIIYLVETGNTYLPIKQIIHADVDDTGEERYFPLSTGGNSYIWIK